MTSHFSLNIKTLSSASHAVILTLAICRFDAKEIFETLYFSLRLEEQSKMNRHVDTKRLHWWFRQMHLPDTELLPDLILSPREAIQDLNKFIYKRGSTPDNPSVAANIVWVRNVQRDFAILENLAQAIGVGMIFQYNGIRDQRTFCEGHVIHAPPKSLSALDTCMYLACQIQKTLEVTNTPLT